MSHETGAQPTPAQIAEVQAALFNLRDGLMNLKMSLIELACMTDNTIQQEAQTEADKLLRRLRGC